MVIITIVIHPPCWIRGPESDESIRNQLGNHRWKLKIDNELCSRQLIPHPSHPLSLALDHTVWILYVYRRCLGHLVVRFRKTPVCLHFQINAQRAPQHAPASIHPYGADVLGGKSLGHYFYSISELIPTPTSPAQPPPPSTLPAMT